MGVRSRPMAWRAADEEDERAAPRRPDYLNDHHRQVIELAFCGGHSHTEIAVILDLPLGTVKSRIRAALSGPGPAQVAGWAGEPGSAVLVT